MTGHDGRDGLSRTLSTTSFVVAGSPSASTSFVLPSFLSASASEAMMAPSPPSCFCSWSVSPSAPLAGTVAIFSVDSASGLPSSPFDASSSAATTSVGTVALPEVFAVSISSGVASGLSSMTASFSTAAITVASWSPDALVSCSGATVVVSGISSAAVVVVIVSELMMDLRICVLCARAIAPT